MKKKGRSWDKPVSNSWWLRFRERWSNLSLRKGDAFCVARDKMTSPGAPIGEGSNSTFEGQSGSHRGIYSTKKEERCEGISRDGRIL